MNECDIMKISYRRKLMTFYFTAIGYAVLPNIPLVITEFRQKYNELLAAVENENIPMFYTTAAYAIPVAVNALALMTAFAFVGCFLFNAGRGLAVIWRWTKNGEVKLKLIKTILQVQTCICEIDKALKSYGKYVVSLGVGIFVFSAAKEMALGNLSLFVAVIFAMFAYSGASKGIAEYFRKVRGFITMLLPVNVYICLVAYEKAFFISTKYRLISVMSVYCVIWLLLSVIAKYEVADVVNSVTGLAAVFVFTAITFIPSLYGKEQIQGFFEHLAELDHIEQIADYTESIYKFAAYLLFFIGWHSVIAAMLKIKKYLLTANKLSEIF